MRIQHQLAVPMCGKGNPSRRALALLIVMWAIVLALLIVASLQNTAFSQASQGRMSLARVRAYWAARAGLEAMIAQIEHDTENPDPEDALRDLSNTRNVATGEFADTIFRVFYSGRRGEELGAQDAHAKINVNRMTRAQLLAIEPLMTEGAADSIMDWIDGDEVPNAQGAEAPTYISAPIPYLARNNFMRSINELELVSEVWQQDVRGEDWNLNSVLDPNEDDGDASWPPDNADGKLDAGWSGFLTTLSTDGGLAASGEERIDLTTAKEGDLTKALGVDANQAKTILEHVAQSTGASMADFIRTNLRTMFQRTQPQGASRPDNLTREQLGKLLDECSIGTTQDTGPLPGKLNINTCEAETLEMLPEIPPELADAIIAERESRSKGFASIVDLLDVDGMTNNRLAGIYELLCVRSNVFTVTSRGRDVRTGIEVEITAAIDRSTLPASLKGVMVR